MQHFPRFRRVVFAAFNSFFIPGSFWPPQQSAENNNEKKKKKNENLIINFEFKPEKWFWIKN